MRPLLLILLFSFFSHFAVAENQCEQVFCGQGRLPVEVCFVHPDLYKNPLWGLSLSASCRSAHELHIVKSRQDLISKLETLNRQCKKITKSSFHGHGTPGHQQLGDLSFDTSMENLKPYSCLFEPYQHVYVNGCNNGNGCFADMMLLKLARSLFSDGVRLTAPTFYATTFLPGVMPHTSVNFKNRKLLLDPSSSQKEHWMQEGLTLSNGGTIADSCGNEIEKNIVQLKSAIAKAQANNCVQLFKISPERMAEFHSLADKVKDIKFYDELTKEKIKHLKDELSYIQRAISFLGSCGS